MTATAAHSHTRSRGWQAAFNPSYGGFSLALASDNGVLPKQSPPLEQQQQVQSELAVRQAKPAPQKAETPTRQTPLRRKKKAQQRKRTLVGAPLASRSLEAAVRGNWKKARKLFRMADHDREGWLSREGFRRFLGSYEIFVSDAEWQRFCLK